MDSSPSLMQQDHDIYKQRLTPTGEAKKEAAKHDVKGTKKELHSKNASCMTCYGSEESPGQCCNTCDEVFYCMLETGQEKLSNLI